MTSLAFDFSIGPAERPKSKKDYFGRLLKNRWWRLNNLYYIKDKDGNKVKFRPNKAQVEFVENLHTKNILLKARQLGMTTLIQIMILDECLFTPNTNAGVIAHTKWDAQTFFKDKVKFAYDNLPPHIKELIGAKNDAAGELRFDNGSVIIVGTSLRSGTYQLLHISEYGKMCAKTPEKAKEVRTGALNTAPKNGYVFIESTAEGRMGDFFDKCEESKKMQQEGAPLGLMDYKFFFFPWWEDEGYTLDEPFVMTAELSEYFDSLKEQGVCLTQGQMAYYAKKKNEQKDEIKREYPSTPEEAFEASIEGAYFARQMAQIRAKGQIRNIPLEPGSPIHTFWDLGRDTTSIWFAQIVGFEFRFVDYYENSGEGMEFYLHVLKEKNDGGEPYLYGDMYLPHDGTRKSLASDKSPADILYKNGYNVRIVQRTPDKDLSIQAARSTLPKCWFDKSRCDKGITRLDSYRKEWDDNLGTWKKNPLHDAASHGADAFMTFSDGYVLDIERDEYFEVGMNQQGRSSRTGY